MKKTLAAVAVLGAFAGSALAADVTLYGIIDTGFAYTHTDLDTAAGATDSFSMQSGQQSGSRFGLKGTEDLGNGLTVGFNLENQFSGDDGQLHKDGFFRRETALFLQGGFGKLSVGRIGSINQGVGSQALIGAINAFGTSWGGAPEVGTIMTTGKIWNNMISYQTPTFAGFKVIAQYSMGDNDNENESTSDRYYAIGAAYNNGPIAAYLGVDSTNYKSATVTGNVTEVEDVDDSLTVTLGGSYDFEVAKVYFGAQYFDEVAGKYLGDAEDLAGKVKGYGLSLGVTAPVAGGKAMFGVGYYDAENADSVATEFDLTRWSVGAGYDYNLSKRTNVYGVVGYVADKYEVAGTDDVKPESYKVMVGLRHKF